MASPSIAQSDGARGLTRISRACERCRMRKVRCNGSQPCARCSEQTLTCQYRTGKPRSRARLPNPGLPRSSSASQEPSPSTSHTRPATTAAEPSFGFSPAEWREGLQAGIEVPGSETRIFQYYGPSSHFAFLQRVYERLDRTAHESNPVAALYPVPNGLRAWGLHHLVFPAPPRLEHSKREEKSLAFLPRSLGERFIRSYFNIVHPQMPILIRSEIMNKWAQTWGPPPRQAGRPLAREILLMVLAIGAVVSPVVGADDLSLTDGWAEFFAESVDIPMSALFESTLQLVHLLMLKASYAQQAMRPHDTYIALGHAARTALALGINRARAVDYTGADGQHLRVTFWALYAMERVTALLIGRPSSLRDDQIDAPCPQGPSLPDHGTVTAAAQCRADDYTFVRVMAEIGKVADRILTRVYSLETPSAAEQCLVETNIVGCESDISRITQNLPSYLNFEIQRLHVGLLYHTLRMLTHRPVLVFTTFFSSNSEAQAHAPGIIQLQDSIDVSIQSARSIITFIHASLFIRQSDARYDGSLSNYLVAAGVTLLYQVLDPATTVEYAKDTFTVIEQAIACLNCMERLGPRTAQKLSADLMQMAKNVLFLSTGEGMMDDIPSTEPPRELDSSINHSIAAWPH
ncbi:hypothetical protein BJY04DRAFT_206975 [Aspergillus karnatakaensis]|uniref:Zn(II)2Cys6 transcription factor n=1 Tax=Aspergillus karnatakaensis TaxID=1810916 RepID=UPI003CCDD26A